jgi:hypothetical protein
MSELQPILVPISQASAIIGKCRRGIYQLIATGQLKAVKSGRSTLVVCESLNPAGGEIQSAARRHAKSVATKAAAASRAARGMRPPPRHLRQG